jgi:hypothetical protein
MKKTFLKNQPKSFNKTDSLDIKNKVLTEKEIIDILYSSLMSLNEEKYSFFNGINNKGEMEYLYFTKDNYIVYYVKPFLKKENIIEIDNLTEKIKIENGYLFSWNKKTKKFEKADVKKIEECFLCRFAFFKKRLIKKIKKRLIFNIALANIKDFDKIEKIKGYLDE